MALDAEVLRELRAELGDATKTGRDDDTTLETIYENEGGESVQLTAWYVWRRRLGDLNARSFDVTTGGALLSRSQRIRFIQGRIAELEFAIGAETLGRFRGENQDLQTTYEQDEETDTELS